MLTEKQKEKLAAAKQQALKTASKTSVLSAVDSAQKYGVMTNSNTGQRASKPATTSTLNNKISQAASVGDVLTLQALAEFAKQRGDISKTTGTGVSSTKKKTSTSFNTSRLNTVTSRTDSLKVGQNLDIKRQQQSNKSTKTNESSFFDDLKNNKSTSSYTSKANSARQSLQYFQRQLEELDQQAQQAQTRLDHSFGRGKQLATANYTATMEDIAQKYQTYAAGYDNALQQYQQLVSAAGKEADIYKNQIDYLQELNTELQVQLAEQIELSKLGTDTTEQMRAIKQQQKINQEEMRRLNALSNDAKSYFYVGKTINSDYDKNSAFDETINDSFYKYINGDEGQFNKATGRVMSGSQSADDVFSYRYMEPDEVKLYNYIYKTEGKDEANEFLDYLKNDLLIRMGQENYGNMGAVEKALYFIPAGLDQWATGVANFSRMISGKDPQSSSTQYTSSLVRQDAYDKNKLLGVGYDLGTTVVNNIPNQVIGMGAGALLSGTNMSLMAANILQKTASGAGIFTSSAGNYYNEALQSGLTMSQARTYAVLSGLSEASLESAIGGISQIGGFAPENLVRLTDGISNAILRGAAQIGISGSSEAVEEGLQSILSPVLKNLITHTDSEKIDWADVGYSAMLGFLASLPSSAAYIAANGTRPTGFNTEQFNDYLASDGTDYFDGCDSLQEVQQRYRQLAKENHPDVGGDASVMADINKQYTIRKAYYSTYEQGAEKYGTESTQETTARQTLELPGNAEQSQAADQNVSTQPTKIETNTGKVANPSPEAHRTPVLISDNNIPQGPREVNNNDRTQVVGQSGTVQNNTVVKKLRNSIPEISELNSVATVKGNEIPTGDRIVDRLVKFINSIGNKVSRPGFGDVLFSRSRIKSSMIGHGTGKAKIELFAAVPEVISNGVQIDYNKNWKNRNYDTYLFAAPVDYKGERTYIGVLVTKDNSSNRYYLHEVVDQNGNLIYENKEATALTSDGTSALSGDQDTVVSAMANNNIPQGAQQVNGSVDSTATAGDNITTNQAQQIQGGTDNVRDYVYNRNRGRNAATYTSQQTGRLGEGAGRTQRAAADAGRTAIKRTAAARDLRLERVSGRDYGISQATENKTFSVLPESAYDEELNTVSKEIYDKTGKQAVFTIGSIEIQTQNGIKAVRGANTNEYIIIQANNPRATATQLGQHEIYHELARQNPGLNEKVMQAITQEHSQQEVDAQIGRYIEHYRGVYDADNPEEGLVFADAEAMRQQEVYDMLKEEFLADAYAGLNSYGAKASRYTDQARSATQEYVPANSPSNQSQGVQQTRGPDETYSVENKEGGKDDERRKMDNSGLRRRFYMENTGERIAKSTGSGGISKKRGKEDELSIYTGTGRRNVYAEDSEGRGVSREQVRQLEGTTVVDDEGRIKAVYHFTPGLEFTEFREGDIGFHFGTKQQAEKRAKDKGSKTGRMFRVYLDIKNPINVRLDIGSWKPQHLGLYLSSEGYITEEQFEQIYDLEGNTYNSPAAQKLREILREKGYDGIEYPNGFEGKGKSYIAFWDDQIIRSDIKNVKFSLEEPVEETKTLVALHNLSEDKLRRTLKLGAFPSPSIAIVRAKQGHTNYGDYSVVFPRNTIDPEIDSRNKVYGSDAWTPTWGNARIDYPVDYDVLRNVENEISNLSKSVAGGAFTSSNVLRKAGVGDSTELTTDEIAGKIAQYYEVKAAYLADKGESLEPVYRKKEYNKYGNDALRQLIDDIGYQELAGANASIELGEDLNDDIKNTVRRIIRNNYAEKHSYSLNRKPKLRETRLDKFMANNVNDITVEDFVRDAWEYYQSGEDDGDEIDRIATGNKLNDMVSTKDAEKWIAGKLGGLLGEGGIYNGKDPFTPSGRARTFKELHYPITVENIVRAMNQASDRGANMWGLGGGGLVATATPSYKNIDEIHTDEGRLQTVPKKEYDAIVENISQQLDDVIGDLLRTTEHHSDNTFEEIDIIEYIIRQAGQRKNRTATTVQRAFKQEGYNITKQQAESIIECYKAAEQVPTGYFEAKPQRVVNFDEVAAVLAPDTVPFDLLTQMQMAGMNVVQYEAGNETDRLKKLNNLPDIRFSIDDTPPWEQARQQWDEEHIEGYDTTAPDYIDNVSDKAIQAAMKRAGVKTLEEYSNWLETQSDNTAQIKEIENDLRTATEQQFAAKPSLNQRMIDSYEQTGQGIKLKQGGMESDQPDRYVGLSEENEDLLEGLHRDMRQLGIDDFDKYLEYRAKQIDEEFMRPKGREEFKGTPLMEKYGIKIAGAAGDYSDVKQIREELKAQKAMTENVRRVERQIKPTEGEKAFARGLVDGIYDIDTPIPGNLEAWKVEEMLEAYWNEAQFDLTLLPNQRKKLNSVYDSMARQLLINSNEHSSGLSAKLMLRTPQRNNETVFGVEDGRRINELIFDPVGENEAESIRWEESVIDRVRKLKDSKGKTRELTKDESAITQLYMEGIMDEDFQQLIDNNPKSQAIKEAASKLDKAPKRGKNYNDFRSSLATEYNLNSTELTLAERYQKRNWAQRLIKDGKADAQIAQTAAKEYRQIYDDFYDIINDFLVIHGYDEIGFRKNYAPHMQDERTKQTMTTAMQAIGLNMDVNNLPTEIAGKTMNNKPNKRWNPFFQKRTGERTQFDARAGLQNYIEFMSDIIFHTDDIMKVRALSRELRGKYSQQTVSDLVEWANQVKYGSREDKLNFLSANGVIQSGTVLSETEIDNAINKMYEDAIKDAENITNYGTYVNWLDEYANQLAGKQSMLDRSLEAFAGRKVLNAANFFTRLFGKAQIAGNISSALNQTAQLPYIVNDVGAKWTAEALKDIATRKVTRDDWYKRSDFLMGKMGYKELAETVPAKVLNIMFKPAEMVDLLMSGIAVRGEYLKQINNGNTPEQAMKLADQKGRKLMGSRLKGEKPTAFNSKNPVIRMALMFSVEAVNSWDHVAHDIPNDIKQYAKENGRGKAAVYWSLKIMSLLAMAFAVNRLAEELYGGTPVPFDVYGMAATTLASGYGLSTNKYLATVFDDIMQEFGGDRFFNTEPIEDKKFNWQAGVEDLLYNLGNDIPLVRNAMAFAGWGDNTLPLPDFSKIIDIIPVAKDVFNDDGDWIDILNAFVQAAGEFMPGGRQITKTASGIMDQINNGITYDYGDNERLRSPGATTWQEVVQEMLFGTNALSQSREYWASGGTTLSAKQTALYQRLVEDGADEWSVYNAINDYRELEANEELNTYERGAQQREIINALDISDEQKFDMLKTLEGWKDDQAITESIRDLLNSNISWDDIMTVYDQVKLSDYDKSVATENNEELTGDEIDNRLRDTISKLNISEANKVKIYTSFTDRDSNAEKFPAMYDTGLSFEQMSEIYGEYSRLNAQLDADESLSASDQAAAFLYWLDLQDLTSEQLKTVTDNYKFWNIFPAQAGKYEKYTDAGISADSAMNLTQALEQAEEENGEEDLSNNEKYRIVVDNTLEGEDRYIALKETISYDTTQAKIAIIYEDYGIDVSNWVIMQEWKENNNVSQYWSQSSAIEALNAMPNLTTAEKAVMWQLCNARWDPDSNPYSSAIGNEVYNNYKARTKEAED